MNLPSLEQVEREILRRKLKGSLYEFFKYFWDVVASEELQDNWHIKYVCDLLQDIGLRVARREPTEYQYYIINIPPGSSKSTMVTIMYPVWCWLHDPTQQFITASYGANLAINHGLKSRDIIKSPKFKELFNVELRDDKDAKTEYENTQGGYRVPVGIFGTITGRHAHQIIIDDPVNPEDAYSETKRETANRVVTQTLGNRKVNRKLTPTIIVMQRLHESDVVGEILNKGLSAYHICLPSEVTPDIKPREIVDKYVGNLFDPVRMPQSALDAEKAMLGTYGYSAQMLQNPVPTDGGVVKRAWIQTYNKSQLPGGRVYVYVDMAYGKENGDSSASVAYIKHDDHIYIVNAQISNDPYPLWENKFIQFLEISGFDNSGIIRVEPKASGITAVQNLKMRRFANGGSLNIKEDVPPTETKMSRLQGVLNHIEAGKLLIPEKVGWAEEFIHQLCAFPKAKHDDIVDCVSAILRIELLNKSLWAPF